MRKRLGETGPPPAWVECALLSCRNAPPTSDEPLAELQAPKHAVVATLELAVTFVRVTFSNGMVALLWDEICAEAGQAIGHVTQTCERVKSA